MSEFHCECPVPEPLPGDSLPYLTVDGLHALTDTDDWPPTRPVMIRIGNGAPRLATCGSQVETAQLHGVEQRVLLIADGMPELASGELPETPPTTVGELVAALLEMNPDLPVVTRAPHGGYGTVRIGTAALQERTGQPRGEGIYVSAGTRVVDTLVGDALDAVTLSWEDDQAIAAREEKR